MNGYDKSNSMNNLHKYIYLYMTLWILNNGRLNYSIYTRLTFGLLFHILFLY